MISRNVSALEVGQAYLELHHRLHRLIDQTMSAAGLSLARTKTLELLNDRGPMNQAALATLLCVAPRSVTDAVDSLERINPWKFMDEPVKVSTELHGAVPRLKSKPSAE